METLHREWLQEFDVLRKLGLKVDYRILMVLGEVMLEMGDAEYHPAMIDSRTKKQYRKFTTPLFTQAFADCFSIVS